MHKRMVGFKKLTKNVFLTRAQHTLVAAGTLQISHSLPTVCVSCLLRCRGTSFQDGVAAGEGLLCVQICDHSAAWVSCTVYKRHYSCVVRIIFVWVCLVNCSYKLNAKCTIHPITNPNFVHSHVARDNMNKWWNLLSSGRGNEFRNNCVFIKKLVGRWEDYVEKKSYYLEKFCYFVFCYH
jgi:hypothetical protein